MGAFDAFALAASHGVFGSFVWLLADAHCKARERGKQASRAEMREWLDSLGNLDDDLPPIGHPGYDRLLLELGARMECPPDPSGLEVDMVAEQNRKAAASEWAVIDLTDKEQR